ncbi:MAG: RNA polymerase sigma factor [Planctomycetota bacterium]
MTAHHTESIPSSTEIALESRARAGDRAAASALLARHRERLVHFCRRYVGSEVAAEDAAQDVLTKMLALEAWPQGSLRAWLYRVARNHCLNSVRDGRHARAMVDGLARASELLSPRTGPRTAAVRLEDSDRLWQAIASLSKEHAEVLFLRYFDELSRDEIASVLDVDASIVKSRLARARQELADRIERQQRDTSS